MAISLSFLVCSILLVVGLLSAEHQSPLIPVEIGDVTKDLDLIHELKKAEIIPTVIDSFKPFLTVSVAWKDAKTEYGNTINPSKTQKQPSITLLDHLPGLLKDRDLPQLTLAITDPDAPSRDNPEWSEFCHWIVTGLKLTKSHNDDTDESEINTSKKQEIMPYKPPGPPPKTGKHRYVFVVLAPTNASTEKLYLEKPSDRQHWGYDKERKGLRDWAHDMGLSVVGANFIYEQNDKQ